MIGLIDVDLLATQYSQKVVYNLELMKLYDYLTKRGEVVELLNHLENYSEYDELHLFQELPFSHFVLKDQVWEHPNVHTHGLFFTGNVYKPFDNLDIEASPPSPRVYRRFVKSITIPANFVDMAARLTNGFIRIHSPARLQIEQADKRNLIIYDNDINVKNDFDTLMQLRKRCIRRIDYVHPLQIPDCTSLDLVLDNRLFNGRYVENNITQSLYITMPLSARNFASFMQTYYKSFKQFSQSNVKIPLIPEKVDMTNALKTRIAFNETIDKLYFACTNYNVRLSVEYTNHPECIYNDCFLEFKKFADNAHRYKCTFYNKRTSRTQYIDDLIRPNTIYRKILSSKGAI